jgi:hypothetical protein
LARRPRTWVAEEEERTRAVADIDALAERLPVTGTPALPVDLQVSIRHGARDVLERGAATPEEADGLWKPLPDYWRTQWRRQFVPSPLPDVRRLRAVDPNA